MKSSLKRKLAALCLLALSTSASGQSNITSPASGSTLAGSADIFKWDPTRYSLWLGTTQDPDAYGRHNTKNAYRRTMEVINLPLDGSSVIATLRWHDGTRWRKQPSVDYSAAYPVNGVWGDCTLTTNWGTRARLLPANHSIGSQHYNDQSGMRASYSNNRVNKLLRDDCASDKKYAEVSQLLVFPRNAHKGIYLWLAPGSGAASVYAALSTFSTGSYGQQRVIHPYSDYAKPVFISIERSSTWNLYIKPLDPEKPVRISEVRMAGIDNDVSSLRKLRFSGSDTFTATNGDPRARITAEIDSLFAPHWTAGEGFFAKHATCGTSFWIDATWEIDEGVKVEGRTVWINFEKASNEEISEAIRASVDKGERNYGPGFIYGGCTRAPDSLIYQDWLGKAAAAKAGTYNGPSLFAEQDDTCSYTTVGRAFKTAIASQVDDWRFHPRHLVDECTSTENSWSGDTGTSVTLDAGATRGMKGIYLWSTFAREESLTIESSLDGEIWRNEWSPAITKDVHGPVYYPLSNRTSRYIRLTGHGSALNSWVNLTEARWVARKDVVEGY